MQPDQPNPSPPTPSQPDKVEVQAASRERASSDVLHLWRRYSWLLVFLGILGSVAVVGVSRMLPAKYQASAQLLVDPRDIQVLDNQVSPQTEAQNIGTTLVETQALVLTSENLLQEVIKKHNLREDPEFNGTSRNPISDFGDRVKKFISFGVDSDDQGRDADAVVLDALQRALSVYRVDRTYVLEAAMTAESRDKARRILETLVAAFLDYQSKSRSEIAERAREELGSGIDGLKQKVAELEQEVALYKSKNDLISLQGISVSEQQLSDLNTQLINARVEAAMLRARLDSTPRRAADLDMVPEAIASQTLRELRVLLARGDEQRARLAAQLLPAHPAMRSIVDSSRRVRSEINQELERITGAIRIDYARAQQKESALSDKLEELREQQTAANQARIKLRELERKLEASKEVYGSAIKRINEANEQMRLSTANIRVISKPHALANKTFPPPTPLLAAVGFVLGLALALVLLHLGALLGGGTRRAEA